MITHFQHFYNAILVLTNFLCSYYKL